MVKKYCKAFFYALLGQIIILPFVELLACVLGFLVMQFFIFFEFIFQNMGFSVLYEAAKNPYNVFSSYSDIFLIFYITRIFCTPNFIYSILDVFLVILKYIPILTYAYFYFFLVDYYSIKLINRPLGMLFSKEILIDNYGFKVSKIQIFVRNIYKLNYLFLSPYFILKNKTLDVFYDHTHEQFIWDIKAELRCISIQEHGSNSQLEYDMNAQRLERVFVNKYHLFNLQYKDFNPSKLSEDEQKNTDDYLAFYLEQQANNQFFHKDNNTTIDDIIADKSNKINNDFSIQYANVLKDTEQETPIILQNTDTQVGSKSNKTNKEILNEQLSKQYENYIDTDTKK